MTAEEIHSRRIAEILDGFGDAFIAFDFDWRIVHLNTAAETHFSLRRTEVLGQVIWELIPGRGSQLYEFLTAAMASRQAQNAEQRSEVHPGRWLAMRAFPLETGMGVSFRDITERRERLRREREQAARLELALRAAGLGDWSWDIATDLVTFSPVAAAAWGLPPGPHMTWTQIQQQLLHPDDRERARLAVIEAMETRGSYEIEYRVQRPDSGEARWVMVRAHGQYGEDGAPTGMIGVLADVTPARAEEAQVRADRERLADHERRRAFLLEISDTLREVDDPAQIAALAARMIGERIGAARAGYAEVSPDGMSVVVGRDWAAQGLPLLTGAALRLEALGPQLASELREGLVAVVDDVAGDPRTALHARSYAEVQIGAILAVPLIRGGRLDAFFCVSALEPRRWTAEEGALAEDVAARIWSSVARARSERALRESEARFRAMADSAPSPVWVTSADGPIEFVNQAMAEFAGVSPDELLGDAWLARMHPDDAPGVVAIRASARSGPSPYMFEARFRNAQGEWRWMHASSRPRFDAAGVFQGYVGLAMDVTDARRAEERQRLLINELNHRVKNTLATVQSLAHQTLRDGMVSREARGRLTDRLLALSAAHNVLTRQNWEAADAQEIVREAIRPYDDPAQPRIRVEGPAVRVAPNVALALSMAMHELATNAVKYGALSAAEGRVDLGWRVEDGWMALEWREAGGPRVVEPPAKGFGSRLLTQGLAAELGSAAVIAFEPTGLVCQVRAPTS